MLSSDGIRPEIKTIDHLVNEARVLVLAGTVSTSHILTVLTFHVVNNPNLLTRLQEELATLTKEDQSWRHLEKLPFLVRTQLLCLIIFTNLIEEADILAHIAECRHFRIFEVRITAPLKFKKHKIGHTPEAADLMEPQPRMGYGTSHRSQRISPDVALQYKEWIIPAGVCLCSHLPHRTIPNTSHVGLTSQPLPHTYT